MTRPQMKAITFAATGAPADVLAVSRLDVPRPGPGEVLVRVDSRPIQPADILFIEGRYRIRPILPQVAGLEGTGTVVEHGERAGCRTGQRVAFRHPGTWAEFAAVPASRLSSVPAGVGTDAAAQFSLNPVTACGLLERSGAAPGDWIAVNAATSSVAAMVAALAARRDVRVVGITRSAVHRHPGFPSTSATGADLAPALLAASGGEPFAALLDAIGGAAVTDALPALRGGATVVSYGVLGPEPARMSNAALIYRNLTWTGFGVDHWLALAGDRWPDIRQALWQAISDTARPLPLPVAARHDLAAAVAAVAEAGRPAGRHGKVLLVG